MSTLNLSDVSVRFGGLQALSEVSFQVKKGEIVGLIGPNGAGKTTVFNVITGAYKATGGSVVYGEKPLLGLRPHKILSLGVARTFQNIRLFGNMSVIENVMVARHSRAAAGVWGAMLRTPGQKAEERAIRARALEELEFMGLADKADVVASNLPYGLQRRLEIARALASDPDLLLLDEPAAGLNPTESKVLMQDIERINVRGISVLMVEHDMKVVMGVCRHIVVLDHGVKIAEGAPEEIRANPAVIEAYLGQSTH